MKKINIAVAGGMCTGKSVLAAALFTDLKSKDFDYDLIAEERKKLHSEFGSYRSPFERFYMWRQQEREELRSTAANGFITDSPLFHLYASARLYSSESRDSLAVRELFRMCLEIEDRYQLITLAEDPDEIPYKKESSRNSDREKANKKHHLVRTFVEHFHPEKICLVKGNSRKRVKQVEEKLRDLGLDIPED